MSTQPQLWHDHFPKDLLIEILNRLTISDGARLTSVCRHWRIPRAEPGLSPLLLPLLTLRYSHHPQLPFIPCFSPLEQRFYRLHRPFPSHPCIVHASRDSWLLIQESPPSVSLHFFSLFNPISDSRHLVPSLPKSSPHVPIAAMWGTPAGPATCSIAVVMDNELNLHRIGWPGWSRSVLPSRADSIVAVDGRFVCNCRGNQLVRVDPARPRVLDVIPMSFNFELEAADPSAQVIARNLVAHDDDGGGGGGGGVVLVRVHVQDVEGTDRKAIVGCVVFWTDLGDRKDRWMLVERIEAGC